MTITKVYTRSGDRGQTSLVGGQRVGKDDRRLEAYGTVDELNSHIGLLSAHISAGAPGSPDIAAALERIQSTLFQLGGHLATDQATTPLYPSTRVPSAETLWLEQQTDQLQAQLPPLQGFILPSGTTAAAQCHVCRAVCRRAERRIVALSKATEVGGDELKYINRLSDYLFVLARFINFNAGKEEIQWQKILE